MPLHTIKDHDHDLQRTSKQEYSVGGYTVKKKCKDPNCEYWVTEWFDADQTDLDSFI